MTVWTRTLHVETPGREMVEITDEGRAAVADAKVTAGLVNVFVAHTSASVFINENADPDVRVDLERFLSDLVTDGDPRFVHTAEGPDDMSAHVRSVLTATQVSIPIRDGRMALGTWQGIYVWEHRFRAHRRRVELTVLG